MAAAKFTVKAAAKFTVKAAAKFTVKVAAKLRLKPRQAICTAASLRMMVSSACTRQMPGTTSRSR